MPSGKTHDKITWYATPVILTLSWLIVHRLDLSLTTTLSFTFAGLMFSGDLDVKSVQYKRWGWFRGVWIPYQKLISHRSPLSHGPVLGTLTRLVYLSVWLFLFMALLTQVAHWFEQRQLVSQSLNLLQVLVQSLHSRPEIFGAGLIGLWLGALSHTWADELGSTVKKRLRKRKRPKKSSRKAQKRN